MSAKNISQCIHGIHHSDSFPATDHVGGNSKIPSIVYYDQDGVPRAFGGEATQESIIEKAEDEEWVKLEWWEIVFIYLPVAVH